MAFKFTLDVVLRFREGLEERELRELEKIQLEIAQASQQIQSVQAQIEDAASVRQQELQNGLEGTRLHMLCAAAHQLDEYKSELLGKLDLLRAKREEQFAVYKTARLDREVLSELKARQKDGYDQKAASDEQKQLDQIFASRRTRS